jgi:Skp family chaperone for outer membrane proteins
MTKFEHLFVAGGLTAAVLLALGLREPTAGAQNGAPPAAAPASTQPAPVRLATVDVYLLAERQMKSDALDAARTAFAKERTDKLDAMANELKTLDNRLQSLGAADPERQRVIESGQAKQQEAQRYQEQARSEVEKFNAKQLLECYTRARDAVNKVADRQGYTHVIANRAGIETIDTQSLAATVQELIARPVLRQPAGDDITQAVSDDMGLK